MAHAKKKAIAKQPRPRHYVVKNGRAFWSPTKRMKEVGFQPAALGPDSEQAMARAERWNLKWDAERKRVAQAIRDQQNPAYQAISALSRNIAGKLKAEFERGGVPTPEPIRHHPPMRTRPRWWRMVQTWMGGDVVGSP